MPIHTKKLGTILGRGHAVSRNGYDAQVTKVTVYDRALTNKERLHNFKAMLSRYDLD